MWIRINPNPGNRIVPDCVVRAISIALGLPWLDVYDDICAVGRRVYSMPSSDAVWGRYLFEQGSDPFILPYDCPRCVTVKEFCKIYPLGRYIIGTGNHAVAVVNGNYYDTWDSGNEVPSFFWRIR